MHRGVPGSVRMLAHRGGGWVRGSWVLVAIRRGRRLGPGGREVTHESSACGCDRDVLLAYGAGELIEEVGGVAEDAEQLAVGGGQGERRRRLAG